ncbi:MAG: hypothetical protein ACJAUD_000339 [Crocinitomicaceae bacterium]|jgi:hypothetical protein
MVRLNEETHLIQLFLYLFEPNFSATQYIEIWEIQ